MTPILVRDLLMNMLLGLTALVVLVLAQINPIAKNNPDSTKPPGQMMVCIYWIGHHDVDLWGRAPDQSKATGYSNKSDKTIDLVRDDLGTDNAPHFECEFARELPGGRWAFGIHGFSINAPSVPVKAEIRLGGEYGFTLLYEATLDIRHKQERTIAQFQLKDGKFVPGSMNTVYVPLRSAQ
jgi:hypothetical protein